MAQPYFFVGPLLAATPGSVTPTPDGGPAQMIAVQVPFQRHDWQTTISVRGPADGSTVCLLHSLGLNRHMFDGLANQLPDFRIVTYDQRGHGCALNDPDTTTLDSMARDVCHVLDDLGIPTAHLVGHSMGGLVSAIAAAHSPARFRSVSIIAAPFRGVPSFAERASQPLASGIADVVDETLGRWFTRESLHAPIPEVDYARRTLSGMSLAHWRAAWSAMHSFGGFDILPRPLPPALCVSGAQDSSAPPHVVEQIRHSIGGATAHLSVAAAAHMVALEQPARLAAVLRGFWSTDAASAHQEQG